MTTVPIIQVDAFTSTAFAGNPAAVALFDTPPDDATLQAIALEMNLSETAYPVRDAAGAWSLRWFTPTTEVDLCGHATLATAAVLEQRGLIDGEVTFDTRSGPLHCEVAGSTVSMDLPSNPASVVEPPADLVDALGVDVVEVGEQFDLVAQLESPAEVAAIRPDLDLIAQLDARAVVVTAAGDIGGGEADFVSRVFAPRVGVPEDPVTGSAHTILAPWWAARLDRLELVAHQVSSRGGHLHLALNGDRVTVTGDTVIVMDATLHL